MGLNVNDKVDWALFRIRLYYNFGRVDELKHLDPLAKRAALKMKTIGLIQHDKMLRGV